MKKKSIEKFTNPPDARQVEEANAYFREQVKRPGLLFCLEHPDERASAADFIRKVKKDFPGAEILIFFSKGKAEPDGRVSDILLFDKRRFNWAGRLKKEVKKQLKTKNFDLFIIFAKKEDKRCRKLTAIVNAALTAGYDLQTENPWPDISLGNPAGEWHYDDFFTELKLYFKQLNIKLSR
jgi:hypothetical protein